MRTWALVVSVMVVACGGGEAEVDGGPGGSPDATPVPAPVTFEEYLAAELQARCMRDAACHQSASVDECLALAPLEHLDELVARGTLVFDGAAAAACLATMETLDCSRSADDYPSDHPCRNVFSGTVAEGGACLLNEECAAAPGIAMRCSYYLDGCTEECCVGLCEIDGTLRAAGEPCTAPTDLCDTGLHCDPASGVCAADATGEPTGGPCDPASFGGCDDLRDYCAEASATCTRLPVAGEPCGDGTFCARNAFCDDTATCAPRDGVGATCAMYDSTCAAYLACVGAECITMSDFFCAP